MQRIKNILSKYGRALIYAALVLCPLFATPASADGFFHDMADRYSSYMDDHVNQLTENCANAPDRAACESAAQMVEGIKGAAMRSTMNMANLLDSVTQFAIGAANTVLGAIGGVYNAIVDAVFGTCPQAAVYYQNHLGGCWSCTIFDTIFTAINSLATETYYRIAPSCAMLMMICAMIWIGVFTIRYIGALNGQEPAEYLTKLFGLLLKTMVVGALLLVSASTFANLIISPVIVASSDLSVAVLHSFSGIKEKVVDKTAEATTTASCDSETGCAVKTVECDKDGNCKITDGEFVRFTPLSCELMKKEPEMGGLLPDGAATPKDEKLLNDQIYNSLMCMVNNLHYEIAYVVSMADAMICYAWTANTTWFLPFKYLNTEMLVSGILIFIAAILISIGYVFKLIDAVFRLGVLCVLLPLLAVAWVFPATVDYAKRGFGMLIHVMMMFITLSIVVSLVLMLVLVAFTSDSGDTSLFQLFNENRIYDMKDLLDFSSLNFLFGLISLFLAFKLLDVVDHMASEFSGVDVGTRAGDQLSMVLAKCTTNLAKGAMTITRTGATAAYHTVGSRIMETDLGHRFHVATRKFGLNAMRKLGLAPASAAGAMTSVFRPGSFESKVADLAGTHKLNRLTKNITEAKHMIKLKAELTKHENDLAAYKAKVGASPSISEKAKIMSMEAEVNRRQKGLKWHEDHYSEAAELVKDRTKLAEAMKVEGHARALEMAYGVDNISYLTNEQKEHLMINKTVSEKENMEKVTKTDYDSLKNVNGNNFATLEEKAKLAEKIRYGYATDDEKERATELLSSGNTDMRNLLAMQETDFHNQTRLIRDTRLTADGLKTDVQKEYKRVADGQEVSLDRLSKGMSVSGHYVDKMKKERETIEKRAKDFESYGWDTGEDTYLKDLETKYIPKLRDPVWGDVLFWDTIR